MSESGDYEKVFEPSPFAVVKIEDSGEIKEHLTGSPLFESLQADFADLERHGRLAAATPSAAHAVVMVAAAQSTPTGAAAARSYSPPAAVPLVDSDLQRLTRDVVALRRQPELSMLQQIPVRGGSAAAGRLTPPRRKTTRLAHQPGHDECAAEMVDLTSAAATAAKSTAPIILSSSDDDLPA